MTQIEETIQASVNATVRNIAESDDGVAGAVIGRKTSAHLLINGSFLYRDKSVRTSQSNRRLLARLGATGKHVRAESVWIVDNETIKGHYRINPSQDTVKLITLAAGVAQELASSGDLLFTLLGTVQGMRPQTQLVDSQKVTQIRLAPSLTGSDFQKAAEGIYSIREIVPVEELLERIHEDLKTQGGLSPEDRRAIVTAHDCLMDEATTDVTVPSGAVTIPNETILGKITTSLNNQVDQYRTALASLQHSSDDQHALNEVLRIAYNFSADVLPLISLFVSICDLKPLVFWCTLQQHWALHQAFASLPWAAIGRKERIDEYKSIVSQARSHAFHHVLPFDSTVEIDLTRLDVRAEKIRLFLPFGQKEGRGVHLKDQKLAEVLAEFSRTKERPVSQTFWKANLLVMQAACKLAEEVLSALALIHRARGESAETFK